MTDRGVDAIGTYVPEVRLSVDSLEAAWGTTAAPGVETTAVPGADEDAITMAVAAAKTALDRSAVPRTDFDFVGIATTTPPLDEGLLVGRISRMLDLSSATATAMATASTVAAAELLDRAMDVDGPALVIASDCPEGAPADADHAFGAGATGFVIDDDAAVPIRDRAWHADDFPGIRFRERGSTDVDSLDSTAYERAATSEAITSATGRLEGDLGEVRAAAIYQPDGSLPYRLARGLSVDADAVERGLVADRIGDAGAAGVPLGLARALGAAAAGDRTLAAFFGGGGAAAAFLFEGALDSPVDSMLEHGTEVTYPQYLRRRGYVADGEVAGGGAHVSLPTWQQSLDARYRLVVGRCPDCGSLAFPPEGACPGCHARVEYERVEPPKTGTIVALTTIGQGAAPPEFAPQQERGGPYGVAIVELAIGPERVRLPAQLTDADHGDVSTGDEVRAVIRRIYEDEGIPRYGAKFTPVS